MQCAVIIVNNTLSIVLVGFTDDEYLMVGTYDECKAVIDTKLTKREQDAVNKGMFLQAACVIKKRLCLTYESASTIVKTAMFR